MLSKASLDYLVLSEVKVMDEDDNVIELPNMPKLPIILRPGKIFKMFGFLIDEQRLHAFRVIIRDPNQEHPMIKEGREFENSKLVSLRNSSIQQHLDILSKQDKRASVD